jgi:hypothetical protein
MIKALHEDITDLCLVSAYDIAKGHAPKEFETLADVVLLDSGLYECRTASSGVEAYLPKPCGNSWSRDDYRQLIRAVAPQFQTTNAIVVSYDTYAPLQDQVELANIDFAGLSTVDTDFLMKPEVDGQFHRAFELSKDAIGQFSIIGVTERELGPSAIARCRAVVQLRKALARVGLNIPVHVFGAITPAAVSAYFFCGADIFDGLNWLRVSLDQPYGGATSEFAVALSLGHLDDCDVQLALWRGNLRTLRRTQLALRNYSLDGNRKVLFECLPFAQVSLELACAALAAEGI